jgi:hypothetical protein
MITSVIDRDPNRPSFTVGENRFSRPIQGDMFYFITTAAEHNFPCAQPNPLRRSRKGRGDENEFKSPT